MRSKIIKTSDLKKIRRTLEQITEIKGGMWNRMVPEFSKVHLDKNSFLIRSEDPVDKMYFVLSGLMRVYYSKADGTQINRNFVFEDRFFTNSLSFLTGTRSHYEVETLEDTELIYFSRSTLEDLYQKYPEGDRIGRILSERNFIAKERKENRMRLMTADEHYQYLVENRPEIILRVPQYHIASYLGVTPETLSRIRSRIRKN